MRIEHWRPVRLNGLASGDYRVELVLEDGEGRPVADPVSRVITVNRDAPAEPASP
jgi:hypothetical protein